MTLIDTNMLLDIVTGDANWADWSIRQLDAAAIRGGLLINDIIYAELSVRFPAIETLDGLLAESGISHGVIPRAALFLAGKVFAKYRQDGGARTGVLPDFFIGAHAAVMGWTLLSRDPQRYRRYFPGLKLITP